jgi:hypothetical protein
VLGGVEKVTRHKRKVGRLVDVLADPKLTEVDTVLQQLVRARPGHAKHACNIGDGSAVRLRLERGTHEVCVLVGHKLAVGTLAVAERGLPPLPDAFVDGPLDVAGQDLGLALEFVLSRLSEKSPSYLAPLKSASSPRLSRKMRSVSEYVNSRSSRAAMA